MLIYCDYIADVIRRTLLDNCNFRAVTPIKIDLNTDGSFRSTKKTIEVTDINGTCYTITIEEKI